MSFPRQFVTDVQDRLVLSDIIGKRVKVIRAGREFKACCPFHKEKTPSFTINNEKGFYHCFGCGAHGDALKFVQEHDNLSFIEALQLLAGLAGLQMPEQTPEEREKQKKQKSLYDLLDSTTEFFERTLQNNRTAMDYLLDRGLTKNTLTHFRVGYAPADGQAVITFLQDKGYTHQDMIDAGVIRKSTKRTGEYYSFFRDRVIFPVADLRGRVVAFGGRILPSVAVQMMSEPPKYINSSDTVLFHKGEILYNLSQARPNIDDETPFIVVEGYMDVIALHQAGFETAVAPLGTAMTESQIELLWRVAPAESRVPILCFDGDNAGRSAASRAVERTLPRLKADQSTRYAFLPQGEDPDSLVQSKGAGAFREFLDNALPLIDVVWFEELEKRSGKTPEERAGLKASIERRIEEIEDITVRKQYGSMLNNRFYEHFNPRKGKTAYQGSYKKGYGRFPPDRNAPKQIKPSAIPAAKYDPEHYILAAIVNYPKLFDELEDTLGRLDIKDEDMKQYRQNVFDILAEQEGLDSTELKDILAESGYGVITGKICNESLYLQATFARPEQKLDEVREGLKFTLSRMRKVKKTG